MDDFVIQYDYPGTSSDEHGVQQPVGTVLVQRVYEHGPADLYDRVFSYTRDPDEATGWPTREEAEAKVSHSHWPNARILTRKDAREAATTAAKREP